MLKKCLCNTPILPTIYSDALSYTEQMCALYDYVEKRYNEVDILEDNIISEFNRVDNEITSIKNDVADVRETVTNNYNELNNTIIETETKIKNEVNEEYVSKNDLTNNRKLDETGNFTGMVNGISSIIISTMLNENNSIMTEILNKINEQTALPLYIDCGYFGDDIDGITVDCGMFA